MGVMVRWLKEKYGKGAVPWVFFCAMAGLAVGGIVGTVFFGVAGIEVGFNISIPAIIVGIVGLIPTGMILEEAGYDL